MDIKTTFFNGDLKEEVYMKHREGFVMPGNEHKDVPRSTSRSFKTHNTSDLIALTIYEKELILVCPGSFHSEKLFTSSKQWSLRYMISDCDDVPNAQPSFMANISSYGSDALDEVHDPDNMDNNMINYCVQVKPSSEQSSVIAVQNSNLFAQQDALILSMIEQLKSQKSVNSSDPTLSSRPTKVEVPKELPKVSMVNTSLKKLKHHLAGFDVVVKERTTATTITEGSWGFEHTKACFRDEIIPFVKALKNLFNIFDQYLIDELTEVQNFFHQMEQAVKQHRLESKTFEVKTKKVLNENERLLEQVISKDIVNIIVNSSMDNAYVNVHECEKCLKLETELLNKKDFVEKEIYDILFKSYTTLEKHCISLEVDTQLNQEIFQRDNTVSISKNGKHPKSNLRDIFINQSKYALESLKKYGFDSCDPVDTPMVEKSKLDEDKKGKAIDPSHYRGMIGTLLYLTARRPDLQFAIYMCARYQARPTEKYLNAVKRIFQYLKGTVHRGLWYSKDSSIALTAFADADHAGRQDTRRSTSGSMQLLGDRLVSWSSKRQKALRYPVRKLNILLCPAVVLKSFG
ncbi:hypothetical protein Tco_0731123 [Tanacetum coccineum]